MKARSPAPVSTTARSVVVPPSPANASASSTISGVDRQLSLRALSTVTRAMRAPRAGPRSSLARRLPTLSFSLRNLRSSVADRAMPLQNRVTPEGEIIATPHRGLMMGNRGGGFHLPDQTLGPRRWATRQWIACVLEFKGRHRAADAAQPLHRAVLSRRGDRARRRPPPLLRVPARATPSTSPSCGHATHGWPSAGARARDGRGAACRACRAARRARSPFAPQLAGLPDGAFVRHAADGAAPRAYLVDRQSSSGLDAGRLRAALVSARAGAEVEVLTPRSIVAVLSAGYRPMLHPSAAALLGLRPLHRGYCP